MKERIKGAFTKKKIFHFLKMSLFVVALSLILLSLLGTVAHATGQEIFIQNIPFPTTSLIFSSIIAGRGFRGTGSTVSENRYNTGFTALPTLSGQ